MPSTESQPTMQTTRLKLRPFRPADAPALHILAGAAEVAATTMRIPHPYPEGAAEAFISEQNDLFAVGQGVTFAVEESASGQLCGCIGLGCDYPHQRAELGYWVGVPYWGHGYATEAVRCVLAFGFGYFRLNRIYATHFTSNPASGRVLEKAGFRPEGIRREHLFKPGRGLQDVAAYGLLLREWAEIAHREMS